MKVVELLSKDWARVTSGQVSMNVSLRLTGRVTPGDYVIVHSGFALETLDKEALRETLRFMEKTADVAKDQPPLREGF
jgi:hydrogenase expression/formation protein HypC